MIKQFLITVIGLLACAANLRCETAEVESTIYNPDPKHLWNRLNKTLFSRTAPDGKQFGLDELDILYWYGTKNLLVEPSHSQALVILDEFTNKHGENLIRDTLKRAFLQRDLWELFDWSARNSRNSDDARARQKLQRRIATLIRRLALTTNEIAALPNNYEQTEAKGLEDLPRGLFQTNGNWLSVGINGYNDLPAAPTHLSEFDGHSAFSVMVRVAGGRDSGISYLDQLRSFAQSERLWIYRTNIFSSTQTNSPRETLELNPKIPQFPTNTEWALVRRMCVIDTEGRIQPTPITESIQLRRYLKMEAIWKSSQQAQQFFEFVFDRRQNGVLRAIGKHEKGFPFVHFRGKWTDPFEKSDFNPTPEIDSSKIQTELLGACFTCHSSRGIFSVQSYTGFLSPLSSQQPANLSLVNLEREAKATIYWKQRQFDWGLLQGLWRNPDKP